MLGERATRPAARAALVAIGAEALEALDRALDTPSVPRRVRYHIPRTISQFDPVAASRIVIDHLARERDPVVHYKLLRGLGRLRAEHPRARIDRERIERAVDAEIGSAFRLLHWRVVVAERARSGATREREEEIHLLLSLLDEKRDKALERAFRLLGVLYPRDDLEHIYRGLRSENRRVQASGLELLGNLLRGYRRTSVLALVDDIPDEHRLESAQPYYEPQPAGFDDCLTEIARDWSDGDEALRALAISVTRTGATGEEGARDAAI
jgi:AAA family ATP:ADP antiporter